MNRQLPRIFLGCVVLAAIALPSFHREQLDLVHIDAWVQTLGAWAPLMFLGLYAIGATLFLPGVVFALASGALFGPVWGSVLSLAGATIGAGISFLIARYLLGDWVSRKAGGRLKRLIEGVDAEGWRFVAFVRLAPLFPFNLANYAFGLTRIPFLTYSAASLLTMAPGAIAYTWLGYAGRAAATGNAAAIRYGLLALGFIATIAFVPHIVRRLRTQGGVGWISAEELRRQLAGCSAPIIIDVRGPDEFVGELGHIPRAINIPLPEISDSAERLRRFQREGIILVCLTDKRSTSAAIELSSIGLANIHVLQGGMMQWNANGLPVSRDSGATDTKRL